MALRSLRSRSWDACCMVLEQQQNSAAAQPLSVLLSAGQGAAVSHYATKLQPYEHSTPYTRRLGGHVTAQRDGASRHSCQ